ncbi:YiiX/YebB-like N1pC/P60 family cysteine hydrolase [uncultured Helicobacter sp.]|uniref:YiiX/YebB-like N1pC/P60 family cysteine hydrolase n=1 Tax=uncultured Helicobacter sp. TaxID=175537 RepID=UPI002618992E|nr:YiiX/YebB-like N1pC/P60 family cysteine hydrolase [uncultured Helicobacter sp.]
MFQFIFCFFFGIAVAKDIDFPPLQIGDFVFRQGIGAESLLIQKFSNSPYSHIAMVVKISPDVLLIHATTNDDTNRQNQVILSSLDEFVRLGSKIAVKRPDFSQKNKEKIVDFAMQNLGREFVLSTKEDAFYCTTFLEEAINKIENFKLKKEFVGFPFIKGYYLFPKAFFEDKRSKLIYESIRD